MSKRRVFDIDFPVDEKAGDTPKRDQSTRKGPMAAAISENADAMRDRAEMEAQIRAENDALAHEHVRLKRMGLLTQMIPLGDISTELLTRDRKEGRDAEIDELKDSIQAIGLSNPIRVQLSDDGFELVQGYRRLTAFKELLDETADEKFASIPAHLEAEGAALQGLYQRMVDENLVRRDISFAEMAQLARHYAEDIRTDVQDVTAAIGILFRSAGRQKRNYIGHFASLLQRLDGHLFWAEAIPRALGLELEKRLADKSERVGWLKALLVERQAQNAREEVQVLRDYLESLRSPGKKAKRGKSRAGAKTTLRYTGPGGMVWCSASDGRVEFRAERDFSILDPRQIEAALDAFFKALDGHG